MNKKNEFPSESANMEQQSQFQLLRGNRFRPFFLTQALGAFNDISTRPACCCL